VPRSLSAKKRVRQNAKKKAISRARKSQVKTLIKRFEAAVNAANLEAATEQFRIVAQKLDKIASTSTMHKKTAARKKSRLAKKLNALKGQKS
jgi:small subunit ribosomal protein S20